MGYQVWESPCVQKPLPQGIIFKAFYFNDLQ